MSKGNYRNKMRAAVPGIRPGPAVVKPGIEVRAQNEFFELPPGWRAPEEKKGEPEQES